MDNHTNIQQLKNRVKDFCEARDWDQFHNAKELAINVVAEGSELLQLFRFKSNEEVELMLQDSAQREKVGDEIADVAYALLRLVQKYDFDLSELFEHKMIKNDKKYPVEKARSCNKKYNEF